MHRIFFSTAVLSLFPGSSRKGYTEMKWFASVNRSTAALVWTVKAFDNPFLRVQIVFIQRFQLLLWFIKAILTFLLDLVITSRRSVHFLLVRKTEERKNSLLTTDPNIILPPYLSNKGQSLTLLKMLILQKEKHKTHFWLCYIPSVIF